MSSVVSRRFRVSFGRSAWTPAALAVVLALGATGLAWSPPIGRPEEARAGVTPSGVLYRPQTQTGAFGPITLPIGWDCSGDVTCSGAPFSPTVGPLFATPGTIPNKPNISYLGWTFTGSGTVTFTSRYRILGVMSFFPGTYRRVDILINGAVVASTTKYTEDPTPTIIEVNATINVAAGDVLTASYHNSATGSLYIDGFVGGVY